LRTNKQTNKQTHKQNSTLSDNKGPLKLSAREPIIMMIQQFIRCHNMSMKSLQWSHYNGAIHPVHAMNAEQPQTADDPWTKSVDLSHWPACRQLRDYIHYRRHYYSARSMKLCVFVDSLLDSSSGFECDTFKQSYANILFQFGFHKQRIQLMKHIESTTPQPHVGLGT